MYLEKTFLAIIPARSGSKGIKDKNIKLLGNHPLMAYTIRASIESGIFDEVIVSTDSEVYADVARAYGAHIPSLRPEVLSDDTATTHQVIQYLIEEQKILGKTYDYIMVLQPTSPFRTAQHIRESVNLLFEKQAHAVISVCREEHGRNLSIPFNPEGKLDGAFTLETGGRRQDQEVWMRLNGAIYLCEGAYYEAFHNFYHHNAYFYEMSCHASLDIDTPEQLEFAQWLITR